MMRRLNSYTTCLLFVVSIVLIIDLKIRCTDNSDSSTYIEKVLEETRFQIKCNTSTYNFSQVEVRGLKDLVMESGGQPLRSLIVSSWRSGSTFLGDIVTNVFPSTYFNCEPLLMYGYKQLRTPKDVSKGLSIVKSMLNCEYEDLEDYFEFVRNLFDGNIPEYKSHIADYFKSTALKHSENCKNENKGDLCYKAELTSQLCKLYPFQSVKIVRLRLKHIEAILDDKALNVKVILLVRDPRGVMHSRLSRRKCKLSSDCNDPALLCADMVSDYVAAGRLLQLYQDRLMVMRFEELALQPNATSHQILHFLKVERTQAFDEFLQSHTNVEVAGAHSTSRLSRNVPYKWKTALDFDYVNEIQMECKEAMRLWGYKMARNKTHTTSKVFNPVDDFTIL